MTTEEFLKQFVETQARMEIYRESISNLHKVGFEDLLRRLSEPENISFDGTNAIQQAAFEHAYRCGWRDCVNTFFDIESLVAIKRAAEAAPTFGAEQTLEELGYGG